VTLQLAVYWRHKFDCYRNGVAALAMVHFSHKQLDRKKTNEKIEVCSRCCLARHLF
jgi:hypothetical protein